jgi:hypothetical protein
MVDNTIMPALIGGVGAVGANMAFKYVSQWLPAEAQTGNMQYLVEGGLIIGAGMLLENAKVGQKKTRDTLIQGALAVTAFRLVDNVATQSGLVPANMQGYQNLRGYQNLSGMGYQSTAPVYSMA